MAGITTSETMRGEQPKDNNFGSRIDELKAEVYVLRKECALLRCRVDDTEKENTEAIEVLIGRIDALEQKTNG
jgi:hypothetical protein